MWYNRHMKWETEIKPEWQEPPTDPYVIALDKLLDNKARVRQFQKDRVLRKGFKEPRYARFLKDLGLRAMKKFDKLADLHGEHPTKEYGLYKWD